MNTASLARRRVNAPEQGRASQPAAAATGHEGGGGTTATTKTVVIDEGLHARLKAKAARLGIKLQALVEAKLRELDDESEALAQDFKV